MKKTVLYLVLVFMLAVIVRGQDEAEITPEVTPEATEESIEALSEPNFTIEGDGVFLDMYFSNLRQGRAGLVGLRGDDIVAASANVFLHTVDFFQLPERDGWWAVIAAEMGQNIRLYDLTITIELDNQDEPQVLLARFDVISGGFVTQTVNLVPDERLETLLDPEIEASELALIFDAATPVTEVAHWGENSFVAPLNAELTSPFGAVRVFNEELETTHTGWDFNSPTGTPLLATASGRVAFAGELDIRGLYVLVNHGQGIYSGYAHMSVVYVTQGQMVSEGQVLGTVGSTGRSSSAHAHFEMIVHRNWVDPADFVRMYMP